MPGVLPFLETFSNLVFLNVTQVLQHLHWMRPDSKAFSYSCSPTLLWYIHLAAIPNCRLLWMLRTILLKMICFLRTLAPSVWTLPLTDATCAHKVSYDFFFILNPYGKISTCYFECLSSEQNAFCFWVFIFRQCCILAVRYKITSYVSLRKKPCDLLLTSVCF